MYEIALFNMPFGWVHLPSIALTQLQSMVERDLQGLVRSRIHYLNHDFAEILGLRDYQEIAESVSMSVAGVGDWMFRPAAFPEAPDDAERYAHRYLHHRFDERIVNVVTNARQHTDAFLDEMIDRYDLGRYAMVGFTTMFMQNVASFALARKLKERNPDVVTVMGGSNCETAMGRAIARNAECIDFVFSGPSLISFPQLIRHVMDGDEAQCHKITGVYSKRKLAMPVLGSSMDEVGEELDINTPVPLDYGEYLDSRDQRWAPGEVKSRMMFQTSRGCWWGERSHCTFCGLNGTTMKYRAMAPTLALELFDWMFDRDAGFTEFFSVDNIMPREYLTEVFPYVRAPQNKSIFYEVKADLKPGELETLAKAGVTRIQPGIEAMNSSSLKLMKKGTTVFQNIRFLQDCRTYGIGVLWNILIGFPREDEGVYRKYVDDLPLLRHLPPPGGAYPIRFDRYSPYFTQAEEYGLDLVPNPFYEMVYPFPQDVLRDLAYYFTDQNVKTPYVQATAKWRQRIQQVIDGWNERWSDGQPEPCLVLDQRWNANVVIDTRGGTAIEHDLDPMMVRILGTLEKPMKIRRVVRELDEFPEAALERAITDLKDRGLIFHEEGNYMSLVMRQDSPVSVAGHEEQRRETGVL